MKTIKVKYDSVSGFTTIAGQVINAGEYYSVQDNDERINFVKDQILNQGIWAEPPTILINDGVDDLSANLGDLYIKDIPQDLPFSDTLGHLKTEVHKPEDFSAIIVTHDMTDPCTWFGDCVTVTGVDLTDVSGGVLWKAPQCQIIDLFHGRLTNEDDISAGHKVSVKVDGQQVYEESDCQASGIYEGVTFESVRTGELGANIVLSFDGVKTIKEVVHDWNFSPVTHYIPVKHYASDEDEVLVSGTLQLNPAGHYKVDYETGTFQFYDSVSGGVKADYCYANGSTFYMIPKPGEIIEIGKSEVQFTSDIVLYSTIRFDVYVYHPDQVNFPGLKVLAARESYKTLKDLISTGNQGQGEIPALPQNPIPTAVFPFDYTGLKIFKSSIGMELRVSTDYGLKADGTFATGTFYVIIRPE